MPNNPLNAPKLSGVEFNFSSYANQFWWVGGLGTSVTSGSSKDSYDWNNPSNWKTWNALNGGEWVTSSRVPGAINGTNDIVFVGGLSFGPTANAPLLYGGFSGSSTTGGYANSTGLTFDAGTTTNNTLLELNIKWEYGYEQKYPFNVVGGGLNSLYSMGVTSSSITGASAAYGVTFGNYSTNPHYQSLKVKSRVFKEESSRANNKTIFLNSVKAVDGLGNPVGLFIKGSSLTGNSWNGGSTTRSKIFLTGFLNEFINESKPSDSFVRNVVDASKIRQDYNDTSLSYGLYGYPEINLGWNGVGCTVGSYLGNNLTNLVVDNNSTVGKININTVYVHKPTTSNVGLENYPISILGEVSDKSLAALGYSLTGGPTGAEYGKVTINTLPQILSNALGVTSDSLNVTIGNFLNISGLTAFGYTGSSRISRLEIVNQYPDATTTPTNILFMGSAVVADAKVIKTKISAWKEAQISSIDIGTLRMNNNSELLLNEAPNINSWSFGLLPAIGATTQILGGIYGDDTSTIRMSEGVAMFNKNINTAVSTENFIVDTLNNIISSSNKFATRPDDVAELPLP